MTGVLTCIIWYFIISCAISIIWHQFPQSSDGRVVGVIFGVLQLLFAPIIVILFIIAVIVAFVEALFSTN